MGKEFSPKSCCDNIFHDFVFQNIKNASPPNKKGVYAIRIKNRAIKPEEIISKTAKHLEKLEWEMVEEYILNRLKRLENITQCPVIYIGSAGTRENSKNTLKGRYKEFSGRHTAMYPIWALLCFGWELEFGWIEKDNPKKFEDEIKQRYKEKHNNRLPALLYY